MVFRASLDHPEIEIVGIDDLCPAEYLAYMLKYDTLPGRFAAEVTSNDYGIVVHGREIPVFAERNPANLPWGKSGDVYKRQESFSCCIMPPLSAVSSSSRRTSPTTAARSSTCLLYTSRCV